MATTDGDDASLTDPPEPEFTVSALQSKPGRLVFTENGNTDAWIATDTTVDVER
jgi:hypothetical protein